MVSLMKKHFAYVMLATVAAAASISCAKESTADNGNKTEMKTVTVYTSVQTKSTLDANHENLVWSTNDKISVFNDQDNTNTSVTYAASGYITVEVPANTNEIYGHYPYYNGNADGPTSVSIYISQNQTQANPGVLNGSYYPMVAKGTVTADNKADMQFYPVASALAINLYHTGLSGTETVSKVKVTPTANTNFIGHQYTTNITNDNVQYKTTDYSYPVTVTLTNSLTLANSKPSDTKKFDGQVYACLAKQSYSSVTFEITTDKGVYTISSGSKVIDLVNNDFVPVNIDLKNASFSAHANVPEPTSKTGWYRVESATWLTAGDRVAIVNNNGTKAMSKVQKSNNRDGVDVTINAEDDYKKLTINDNVQQFILENGTVAGSFAFWCDNGDEASKYIFAASSSSNHLKSSFTLDANASFTPSIIEGLGSLTAQGSNSHKVLRYNNLFSCYTSASYDNISLYKYYGTWPGAMVCANPTISQSVNTVTIECTSPGVTIYYTTDGTNPDKTNNEQKYTHAFNITQPVTVKAIAVRSHYTDSEIVSKDCSVNVATPVITFTGTSFSISCATEGATIYYKTSTVGLSDIVEPLESPVTYSAAVPYSQTTYVKAYAVKSGYTTSATVSQTCTYSAGSPNTYSCTFTNKSWATNAASDFSWISEKDGAGFSNNGIQVTTGSTGANATTNKVFGAVSQVIVTYNTNTSKGAGTLELKIGSNNTHTENWAYSTGTGTSANYTCTFSLSSAESGAIKLTANTTQNSIYIVSVSVKAMTMSDPE